MTDTKIVYNACYGGPAATVAKMAYELADAMLAERGRK